MNQREGERGNTEEYRSQSWVENINMTECTQEIGALQYIYINSDKNLPQSPIKGCTCGNSWYSKDIGNSCYDRKG